MTRNRKNNDDARSDFPKADDSEVVDIGGQRSPNTMPVPRPRTASPALPSRQPRQQIMINAESGERLGENMQKATMRDVRKAGIRAEIGRATPGEQDHLGFIFGIDRA